MFGISKITSTPLKFNLVFNLQNAQECIKDSKTDNLRIKNFFDASHF